MLKGKLQIIMYFKLYFLKNQILYTISIVIGLILRLKLVNYSNNRIHLSYNANDNLN